MHLAEKVNRLYMLGVSYNSTNLSARRRERLAPRPKTAFLRGMAMCGSAAPKEQYEVLTAQRSQVGTSAASTTDVGSLLPFESHNFPKDMVPVLWLTQNDLNLSSFITTSFAYIWPGEDKFDMLGCCCHRSLLRHLTVQGKGNFVDDISLCKHWAPD